MSHPLLEPEIQTPATGGRWMVVIHNNDHNSFDEVIIALMDATGCDSGEASIEAWEAHTFGKAPVHFAARSACETAAQVIESAGIRTEVAPEWND